MQLQQVLIAVALVAISVDAKSKLPWRRLAWHRRDIAASGSASGQTVVQLSSNAMPPSRQPITDPYVQNFNQPWPPYGNGTTNQTSSILGTSTSSSTTISSSTSTSSTSSTSSTTMTMSTMVPSSPLVDPSSNQTLAPYSNATIADSVTQANQANNQTIIPVPVPLNPPYSNQTTTQSTSQSTTATDSQTTSSPTPQPSGQSSNQTTLPAVGPYSNETIAVPMNQTVVSPLDPPNNASFIQSSNQSSSTTTMPASTTASVQPIPAGIDANAPYSNQTSSSTTMPASTTASMQPSLPASTDMTAPYSNQTMYQPNNQTVNQPMTPPAMNQTTNQTISQPTVPTTNQTSNQTVGQPVISASNTTNVTALVNKGSSGSGVCAGKGYLPDGGCYNQIYLGNTTYMQAWGAYLDSGAPAQLPTATLQNLPAVCSQAANLICTYIDSHQKDPSVLGQWTFQTSGAPGCLMGVFLPPGGVPLPSKEDCSLQITNPMLKALGDAATAGKNRVSVNIGQYPTLPNQADLVATGTNGPAKLYTDYFGAAVNSSISSWFIEAYTWGLKDGPVAKRRRSIVLDEKGMV